MQVVSFTHTIVSNAGARVFKDGPPIADAAIVNHEPGVVLELPDEESTSMIERGLVERYVRSVHGENTVQIARRRFSDHHAVTHQAAKA